MLPAKYAVALCLVLLFQQSFAENNGTDIIDNDPEDANTSQAEVDEEFLEILGSVDADEGDWFEMFMSTIDEAEAEDTPDSEYE